MTERFLVYQAEVPKAASGSNQHPVVKILGISTLRWKATVLSRLTPSMRPAPGSGQYVNAASHDVHLSSYFEV
jgi:hypothetical protein